MMELQDADYYHALRMLVMQIVLYRVIAIYLMVSKVNPKENRRQRVQRIASYQKQTSDTAEKGFEDPFPGLSASLQQFRIKLFN